MIAMQQLKLFFKNNNNTRMIAVRQFFDFLTSIFSYFNNSFNLIAQLFAYDGSNLLALDIGSSSIKVIELEKKNNKIFLAKFMVVPIPEGCVNGHTIKNYSIITEKLHEIINSCGYNNRDSSIILSGPQ